MAPFRCLLCNSDARRHVLDKGALSLARCGRCGFVQLDPMPSPREIEAQYHEEGHYRDEILQTEAAYLERDRRVVAELSKLGATGPLLDVGAGAGTLCRAAREAGWDVTGLEISRPGAERIRTSLGIEVHESALEDAPLEEGRFGLVTFSHSLEHVPDPMRSLQRAARLLKPGGMVHVAVPNWAAAKRLLIGAHVPWIYPHHVSYFSRATLGTALERAGLAPVAWRVGRFLGDDFPFVIGVVRRFRLDGAVRAFLRMGERPLEELIGDDIRISCPPWRFRAALGTARAMLRMWPEGLACRLGRGEELRVTARSR